MKNSIKLTALFLLLSTGVFASTAATTKTTPTDPKDGITVTLQPERGVNVSIVDGDESSVRVYDSENHVLQADFLPNKTDINRNYILTDLDNGDYAIEVTSNNDVVTKTIRVDEDANYQKTVSFID